MQYLNFSYTWSVDVIVLWKCSILGYFLSAQENSQPRACEVCLKNPHLSCHRIVIFAADLPMILLRLNQATSLHRILQKQIEASCRVRAYNVSLTPYEITSFFRSFQIGCTSWPIPHAILTATHACSDGCRRSDVMIWVRHRRCCLQEPKCFRAVLLANHIDPALHTLRSSVFWAMYIFWCHFCVFIWKIKSNKYFLKKNNTKWCGDFICFQLFHNSKTVVLTISLF